MKFHLLSLCVLLSACAPMWGGKTGRFASTNAICDVVAPVVARKTVTAPSWRYNSYNLPVPSHVAVGVAECSLTPGMRVKITGMGYETGQKAVYSQEKQCGGDVPVTVLDRCEGGLSATEIAFPFTRPLPVIERR